MSAVTAGIVSARVCSRLAHSRKDNQVARSQLHGIFDDFGNGRRFSEVRDPNHQASPLLRVQQCAHGAPMIGFERFRANLSERFDNRSYVMSATAGVQIC